MKHKNSTRRPPAWIRLDNAAKIFPPTSQGADSGVFRLSCELAEPVKPDLLQQALEQALAQYPHMQTVLRRGLFWYYLEQSSLHPQVVQEQTPPCTPLYHGSHSLLFQLSYWRAKVNLEVFHVLADGSGAISFFQTILIHYLALYHPDAQIPIVPQSSTYGRREDGFARYYQPHRGQYTRQIPAFHLHGAHQPDNRLTVLEGVCDITELLAVAHRHQTTLTVYRCAVLIQAIHGEMSQRDLVHPVVITVPVDLRNYFPTETARNFFGTIRVSYNFQQRSGTFEDILSQVSSTFQQELTPERLARRMNALAALEHNLLIRPIPLVLKNLVLWIAGILSARGETATLSNIGQFHLPEALRPYICGFGVFSGTHCTELCTCSFEDSFHMGFTSVFLSPEVQRRFFKQLTEDGVQLEIRSNGFYPVDIPVEEII